MQSPGRAAALTKNNSVTPAGKDTPSREDMRSSCCAGNGRQQATDKWTQFVRVIGFHAAKKFTESKDDSMPLPLPMELPLPLPVFAAFWLMSACTRCASEAAAQLNMGRRYSPAAGHGCVRRSCA